MKKGISVFLALCALLLPFGSCSSTKKSSEFVGRYYLSSMVSRDGAVLDADRLRTAGIDVDATYIEILDASKLNLVLNSSRSGTYSVSSGTITIVAGSNTDTGTIANGIITIPYTGSDGDTVTMVFAMRNEE